MTRLTENKIEEFTIELQESLDYEYIYAQNIAPEFPSSGGVSASGGRGGTDQCESYDQVLLPR